MTVDNSRSLDFTPETNSAVDLRQGIRHLDSLPAMPVIAQKLMSLNLDSDEGEQQMIAQDSLISAKIIGLSNSPLLGLSRKAGSVKEAAMLLGLNRVKTVATGIAVMSLARIIHVAEKLIPSVGLREFVGDHVSTEEWTALGIDQDKSDEIAAQANQAVQFVSSL